MDSRDFTLGDPSLPDQQREVFKNPLFGLDEADAAADDDEEEQEGEEGSRNDQHNPAQDAGEGGTFGFPTHQPSKPATPTGFGTPDDGVRLCMSVCLPVCLSVCVCVCLSVCLSV